MDAPVPLLRLDPPARIAIFRALQLGDLLCSVPALRALRAACPGARITLIGLPWARDLVERLPYLDDFLEFPGYPGLPERRPEIARLPGFFAEARRRRFDLAIQLHGAGPIVNPIVERLGARWTAGFTPGPPPKTPPARFLSWPDEAPEVHRYLALAALLGAPARGDHLELPVHDHERDEAAALRAAHGLRPQHYVCIHPGARLASRRWAPERFAAVAHALAAAGHRVVLTGTAGDAPVTAAVRAAAPAPLVDLTGRTSLGALAALVGSARLVVCNDTGMSHVAAAMRTPSVVVSSGADALRWRPLDLERHQVLWHPVACRPCAHDRCPTGHECAAGVGVAAVLAAAGRALREPRRDAA